MPDDAWSNPSPCEGWTARDLVGHLIEVHGRFQGLVGRDAGRRTRRSPTTRSALGRRCATRCRPTSTTRQGRRGVRRPLRPLHVRQAVDGFVCFDLVVHGWDLARATGQDDTIDPDEVERIGAMVDGDGPTDAGERRHRAARRAAARRLAAGTAAVRARPAAVTPDEVRAVALSFDGATERDHHGFPSFRTHAADLRDHARRRSTCA